MASRIAGTSSMAGSFAEVGVQVGARFTTQSGLDTVKDAALARHGRRGRERIMLEQRCIVAYLYSHGDDEVGVSPTR
jgi:hypothetical protein